MKIKMVVLSMALAASLLGGCATKEAPKPAAQPTPAPAATTPAPAATTPKPVDAVTTASLVNTAAAFEKGISKDGTWIISTLKDLKSDKELVLEGTFKNKDVVARKIALYTQDEAKKVTARFTYTAPKLTIKSENARIQSGTWIGDVYVEAANFQLVDATVQGNLYFANDQVKSTFKMDGTSKVTGKNEVKK